MLKRLARYLLKDELLEKDIEIKNLKQQLQYRHTTINDLRYKTKILEKMVSNVHVQDELQQSSGVAQKVWLFAKQKANVAFLRKNGTAA